MPERLGNWMDSTLKKEKIATSSTCKDCNERKVGCHGICDKYLQYLQEKQAIKDKNVSSAVESYRMEKKRKIEAKMEKRKWKRH